MDIFEQRNLDFTRGFSNILDVIKVQFSQKLRDFERTENFFKIVNYPDLFDAQYFDNNCYNWVQLENLEMQFIKCQPDIKIFRVIFI